MQEIPFFEIIQLKASAGHSFSVSINKQVPRKRETYFYHYDIYKLFTI